MTKLKKFVALYDKAGRFDTDTREHRMFTLWATSIENARSYFNNKESVRFKIIYPRGTTKF